MAPTVAHSDPPPATSSPRLVPPRPGPPHIGTPRPTAFRYSPPRPASPHRVPLGELDLVGLSWVRLGWADRGRAWLGLFGLGRAWLGLVGVEGSRIYTHMEPLTSPRLAPLRPTSPHIARPRPALTPRHAPHHPAEPRCVSRKTWPGSAGLGWAGLRAAGLGWV